MTEDDSQDGVSVHAGFPNPAADQSLHGLDLHKLLVRHSASTYLFRVRGNEWEAAGVFDGDIALVDRALDPRRGDVVIWWDGTRGEFVISVYSKMPTGATLWGVITASIHEFRKGGIGRGWQPAGRPRSARTKEHGEGVDRLTGPHADTGRSDRTPTENEDRP